VCPYVPDDSRAELRDPSVPTVSLIRLYGYVWVVVVCERNGFDRYTLIKPQVHANSERWLLCGCFLAPWMSLLGLCGSGVCSSFFACGQPSIRVLIVWAKCYS